MGFDNYVKTNFKNLTGSTKVFMKEAYEAGAQSRQAEIDGLQKRIDETIELINSCFNPSKKSIIDILKGNKND